MIIYTVICVSVLAKMQCLNIDHSHNMPVRRKTDYKVNISIPDGDIEMVDMDNLIIFNDTADKFSKKRRKKPRTSRTNILLDKYNDNNTRPPQNFKATSEPSHNRCQIEDKTGDIEEQASILRIARETSADRIRKIVQIWLFVYIVLAVPIWCTIGRCCCCLFCKCFKAQETIRQAKQYSMWNAPGVLRNKSGDIIYEPSEREKQAHEELEHLIRTL